MGISQAIRAHAQEVCGNIGQKLRVVVNCKEKLQKLFLTAKYL